MPAPPSTWNTKRVYITYRNALTQVKEAGTWTAKSDVRITNTLGDGSRQVFRSGPIGSGALSTIEGIPSLAIDLPVVDDPDNMPNGGQITLTVTFSGGATEVFKLSPLMEWPDVGEIIGGVESEGTDLALILNPSVTPGAPPYAIKGIRGGVAALDSDGDVLDADGNKIIGGGGGGGIADWDTLVDKPAVVAAGSTQAAARTVIAVPSTVEMQTALDLKVNTSTYTSAIALKADATALTSGLATKVNTSTYTAGMATKADLVSGTVPLAQLPSITSAKVSDFQEATQDAVAALLAQGTGVTLSYDDTGNVLTVTSTGAGGLDAEAVRDAMGVAMIGVAPITVTVNDAGDTITISTTATVNSTDAALRDRSTHTGTQAASTLTGLGAALGVSAQYAAFLNATGGRHVIECDPITGLWPTRSAAIPVGFTGKVTWDSTMYTDALNPSTAIAGDRHWRRKS